MFIKLHDGSVVDNTRIDTAVKKYEDDEYSINIRLKSAIVIGVAFESKKDRDDAFDDLIASLPHGVSDSVYIDIADIEAIMQDDKEKVGAIIIAFKSGNIFGSQFKNEKSRDIAFNDLAAKLNNDAI